MGEVPKIRFLAKELDISLRGEDFQRHIPTTLSRDFRRPGVPPTPRLGLDVLVWMGTHATIPLAAPSVSALLWRVQDGA